MQGRFENLRHRHTLLTFTGVLLAFTLVADALLVTQQRRELLEAAQTFAWRELGLLGTWVATTAPNERPLLQSPLREWAREDPLVAALSVQIGDRLLLRYRGEAPPPYAFQVTRAIPTPQGESIRLTMVRDTSRIESVIDRVRLQLIAASTLFVAILGTFLWVTVRRMALLPMRHYEDELQMHRYRLERLVQERTAELTASNRNLRDQIREREETEQKLRRSTERLEALRAIDQAILASRSLPEIAQNALERLSDIVPCKRAVVSLFDFENAEADVIAVHSDAPTRLHPGDRLAIDPETIPESIRQGQPFPVPDLHALDRLSPMETILAEEGARAYVIVPLTYRGELFGALHLAADSPDGCGAETLVIASEVADVLALAIAQTRLNTQIQHHAEALEQRVGERTQALREAQADLEAFTYSVSHDLRSHLWTVQGFTERLRERYAECLGEEGADYAQSITEAVEAMAVLIRDLLAYSHINRREIQLAPVSLDRVLDEVLATREAAIRDRGARIEVASPLGEVRGHRATLLQVLSNLVDNALTYVADGVTPRVRLYSEPVDGRLRLWVEDNGVGIPEAQRERVFRVFERLHPETAYPGTGVGLAIVKRGIVRLGGEVGVESRVGQGSRFWIELPVEPSG